VRAVCRRFSLTRSWGDVASPLRIRPTACCCPRQRGPNRQICLARGKGCAAVSSCKRGPTRKRAGLLVAFERVSDEPEHGWPEAHEQGTAIRVSAFVLVDGLGADPQRHAQPHGRQRKYMEVPPAQACRVERLSEHRSLGYPRSARVFREPHGRQEKAELAPADHDRAALAGGRGPCLTSTSATPPTASAHPARTPTPQADEIRGARTTDHRGGGRID
jgi:hypothetical protein